MKKLIVVIMFMGAYILPMQQKRKEIYSIQRKASIEARQKGQNQYDAYKKFRPQDLDLKENMLHELPLLFVNIPDSKYHAISEYAEFLYGKDAIQRTKEQLAKDPQLQNWQWNALALSYNVMPYYNVYTRFFHFEQSEPNETLLKGTREDYHLPLYVSLQEEVQKISKKLEQAGHELDVMESEYKYQCNKPQSDQRFCTLIKTDLEKTRNAYRAVSTEYQIAEHKKIEFTSKLVQEYKIHIMPTGELTPVIIRILEALQNDQELQKLIAAFKVYQLPDYYVRSEIIPRIVIYPTAGKENSQKALNKLYVILKDIKGSGIRPRYNAKVNDLIWIAQGDSVYKNDPETEQYFELPHKIYYRTGFTLPPQKYYLLNPETKEPILY